MTIINEEQLDKKVVKIVRDEMKPLDDRIDGVAVDLQQTKETIKCMEVKMKDEVDLFALGDAENDRKKEYEELEKEELKAKIMEESATRKCDYCRDEFSINDLDLVPIDDLGSAMLCRNCEENVKEGN